MTTMSKVMNRSTLLTQLLVPMGLRIEPHVSSHNNPTSPRAHACLSQIPHDGH